MRTVVLVDGEHYPPVVRAAIDRLPERIPTASVVAAALLGGTEKLRDPEHLELGVPVVTGTSPLEALRAAIDAHAPELVVDLSDEPVVDNRTRLLLASTALVAGASYAGADFRLDPPARPRLSAKPTIAVIGSGKRTGKTAVSAAVARLLVARGTPPVIVAMGRGGPPEPEVIDPAAVDLSVDGLLALADSGRHAASDHIEDALMTGVVTVGTRRCGGGVAGAPFDDNFAAGVAQAEARPETVLVYEGSGRAIPPAHADATLCVVPAHADPELVCGYAGAYRLLLSDLVVITMADAPAVRSVDNPSDVVAVEDFPATFLESRIRELVPGARIIRTVLRPSPLQPVSGRRIVYATTAPAVVGPALKAHLEQEHGAMVVGVSHHLANRPQLRADLEAMGDADILVVELKAAAVDVAARVARGRGMQVVFCDNRVVAVGGTPGGFEEAGTELIELALTRHTPTS
jgi:cyclic 2,3-diphosphoglycerate synthetase